MFDLANGAIGLLKLAARNSRRHGFVALAAVTLSAPLTAAPAAAQFNFEFGFNSPSGEFRPARTPNAHEAQALVDRMTAAISIAMTNNAADPAFLEEMLQLAAEYYWPWRATILSDNFEDCQTAFNTQWLQSAGVTLEPGDCAGRERGLVLDATGGGIPPGFTHSNSNAWDGSVRKFKFDNSNIEVPTDHRAIHTKDDLVGDFIYRFRIGETVSPSGTVGLFSVSEVSTFRGTSGKGRIDRMDESWWMVGDGRFYEGNEQKGATFIQPNDLVEYTRRADLISVAVNGVTVHQYSQASFGPVRAVIATDGYDRFGYNDVAWLQGNTSGSTTILKDSHAAEWQGNTGEFSFQDNSIRGERPNSAIYTSDFFDGDFAFRLSRGPDSAFNTGRFGVYEIAEDTDFDASDAVGGMRSMLNSWYFMGDTLGFGCCSEARLKLRDDDDVEFRRIDGVFSILVNDKLEHIFANTSTAPVRAVISRGGYSFNTLEYTKIAWTAPLSSSTSTEPILKPPKDSSKTLTAILAALDIADGVQGPSIDPEFSVLVGSTSISRPFAIIIEVSPDNNWPGSFDFGIFQRSGLSGYRVEVSPANFPGLRLIRTDFGGDTILGSARLPENISDGGPHTLQLTRDAQRDFELSIDGSIKMRVSDQGTDNSFDTLTLLARDGLFTVHGVSVMTDCDPFSVCQ